MRKDFPFLKWDIEQVIRELTEQVSKTFPRDGKGDDGSFGIDLVLEEYSYYEGSAMVETYDDIRAEIIICRTKRVREFKHEYSSDYQSWDLETKPDTLFGSKIIIDFYDKMLEEGIPDVNAAKKNKPSSLPKIGFDTYIEEEHRAKLMPYLKENYIKAQPKHYGFMLYALVNCGYVQQSVLNGNKSELHRALENTFGECGTRQALDSAILRLDQKEINDEDKKNIEAHKQRIADFLKPHKPI